MKIARILAAAGLMVVSIAGVTAADAQYYRGHDRGYHRGWDHHRGYYGHGYYGRHYAGHGYYGHGYRHDWRHHHGRRDYR